MIAALRGRYRRRARKVRLVSTAARPHTFGSFERKFVRLGVSGEEGRSEALLTRRTTNQRATAWLQDTVFTRSRNASVLVPLAQVEAREAAPLHPACGGLVGKEQRAHARWQAGGGKRGEARRRTEAAKAMAQKRLLAAQREMAAYTKQGAGKARRGLSGQALGDVGERIHVEISPRGRARRKRKRRAAASQAIPQPVQRTGFDDGSAPNVHNKWKVDRVLEVRRVAGGGRKLEARVRWHGCPRTGPAAGLPWPDSWRAVDRKIMTQALYDEARAMERVRFGLLARGGAVVQVAQVAGTRRCARHLDANDEQLPMPPPRRRRRGLEIGESPAAPTGGAMSFLRACEAAAAARAARTRGEKRQVGMNDEYLPMPPPRRRRVGQEIEGVACAAERDARRAGFLRACEAAAAARTAERLSR